ncbi:tRNA pseudouridine55 synthase [Alkalihalobacillus xiaoxiensis]|uniref:tRNA pseudouridine synthase B n=1 Tax=Shouchella xiaoxiensis TaxID=766895 RepID=A0ABS2SR72_9BACI|nr:tRNA pseudouridine(55) synthase TruB [Shouchella xiaoxiensis]MBM7837691.1 tRNA pseudouridine55 synthase [Shouchella xiaoxiensis]
MEPSGILALHKPRGMTSHDCVYKLRKLFQTKKVGHTGTLDPEVDGVLPICIGRATKVAEYMTNFDKTYVGEVTLGFTTTTEDAYGELVEQKPVLDKFSAPEIKAVLQSFTGEITQTPPYYSAVKVNGKRLYEYARAGIEVERPSRHVQIYALEFIDSTKRESEQFSFAFQVTCSKGTYVRTLAVDIGRALGYPAHMSKLTRTASGSFLSSDTITFEALEEMSLAERQALLYPFDRALEQFPRQIANRDLEKKIRNGAVLDESLAFGEQPFLFYNEDGECLALYKPHPSKAGLIKPEKLFCQSAGL